MVMGNKKPALLNVFGKSGGVGGGETGRQNNTAERVSLSRVGFL